MIFDEQGLPYPADATAVRWFDLHGLTTPAVLIEARQSGVDRWWPSWNVAMGGFVLEGSVPALERPHRRLLHLTAVDLSGLPLGVTVERRGSEVRYRTRFLEIGFLLGRAGLAYLALDGEGQGRTHRNLLRFGNTQRHPLQEYWAQGVRLRPVAEPSPAGFLEQAIDGTCRVEGHVISYDIRLGESGQQYRLRWEVWEERLQLTAERIGERPIRAWESGALHLAFDARIAATTVLGRVTHQGEAGLLDLPVLLHAPGFGTLRVEASPESTIWRADAAVPIRTTTSELKIGEVPQSEGDYLLLPGQHRAEVTFIVAPERCNLGPDAPPEVERALRRCALTALTYRPDTTTFSNNGCSMHAPICMDTWSAMTTRIGAILPELTANELLRDSLERWLHGAPGYASGPTSRGTHRLEDEYVMTGAACLLALAEYLRSENPAEWAAQEFMAIGRELARMRARDLDGDGLVESPHRLGISGQHQWSTNWWDVISFGWKDAFANALLYPALRIFAEMLPLVGQPALATGLAEWADRLWTSYVPTFYNPATGWLAGWRCKENRLHDYAFLFINGAAVCGGLVDTELARTMISRLWAELERSGLTDFRVGLPGNLWVIPDADLAEPLHGLPMGCFDNGGATHKWAHSFRKDAALRSGFPGARARGTTDLERAAQHRADRLDATALANRVEQHARGQTSELVHWFPHRGERRMDAGCIRDVVEADD